MTEVAIEDQISRISVLEPGEKVLAVWSASFSAASLGKVVVTSHRFLYFRTKGVFHPVLDSIVTERSFRLEAIAPVTFHNAAKSRWIGVGGYELTVNEHPQVASEMINSARQRRRAELGIAGP